MLLRRVVVGGSLVAGLVGLFWLDHALEHADALGLPRGSLLVLLTVALLPLAGRELVDLLRARGLPADTVLVASGAVAACLTLYAAPSGVGPQAAMAALTTVLFASLLAALLWHCRRASTHTALLAAASQMLAVTYLGLGAGGLVAMRRDQSAWVVLAVLGVTKACDVGAYFTGRAVGRHKLAPSVSPGKTWEGLLGGLTVAAGVAAALATLTGGGAAADAYHAGWTALAGAAAGCLGQGGDLLVSLFKRDVGVKDSGSLLPGFGGFLDLLDSPLVVAPVACWLLRTGWLLSG